MLRALALTCGAVALAAACSSDSSNQNGDAAAVADAAAGDAGATGPAVGAFLVELIAATEQDPARTRLSGAVYDRPPPSLYAWDLVEESGGCRLAKPRAPFCNPKCGAGVCVDGNQCVPQAVPQDVGTVRVKGVGPSDVTMTAVLGSYEGPSGLPYPGVSEGAPVDLTVAAGAHGPFSLRSQGIAPLVSAGPVTLERGKPVSLMWTAPGKPGSQLNVHLDISHHGGTKGAIDCEVPDTGSLEIAASMVGKLIDLGVAGFPSVELTRVATGRTALPHGRVDLQVLSAVVRPVVIPGQPPSCNEGTDCPSGRCRPDKLCDP